MILTDSSSVNFSEHNLLCRKKQVVFLCNFKRRKSLYVEIIFVKTIYTSRRFVHTEVKIMHNSKPQLQILQLLNRLSFENKLFSRHIFPKLATGEHVGLQLQ